MGYGRTPAERANDAVALMHREKAAARARGGGPTLTAEQVAQDRRDFLAAGGEITVLPAPWTEEAKPTPRRRSAFGGAAGGAVPGKPHDGARNV